VHEIFTNINAIKEPNCYPKCEELSFEIKKSDKLVAVSIPKFC
jgi:hypothetical protein